METWLVWSFRTEHMEWQQAFLAQRQVIPCAHVLLEAWSTMNGNGHWDAEPRDHLWACNVGRKRVERHACGSKGVMEACKQLACSRVHGIGRVGLLSLPRRGHI
eukprot:1161755-Pelagomonas_calceolata.AAC.14